MLTSQDLVRREVHYCVSSLVHSLAQGYGMGAQLPREIVELHEQAFELASPVPDYEEAAREAGCEPSGKLWTYDFGDGTWRTATSLEEVFRERDLEPYYHEVFEHWIVSDWLADRLATKGEKVDKYFAGLTVWARTTTGRAIYADSVIEEITKELNSDA